MRWIAGDVGGTKTLLRCVEGGGAIVADMRYDNTRYSTFEEVLAEFMGAVPGRVDAACVAVAGPVHAGRGEITNLGWAIDEGALRSMFGFSRVSLINDFHAVALGVPVVSDRDMVNLRPGDRVLSAPIAILGAGTGLGEAMLIPCGGRYEVVATEGGHADFAPQDEEQTRLFLELHKRYGHVSWERLVSGSGLVNIFTFLGGDEIQPAEIFGLARRNEPRARRAVEMFVDIYGAEAGNMALHALARGGVYLAGGIAAKNVAWFTDGRFAEAFVRKGRFRPFLETVRVDLVTNESVGLLGAGEWVRRLVNS